MSGGQLSPGSAGAEAPGNFHHLAGLRLGKTNPLNDRDLAEFVQLQKSFADSAKSWSVEVDAIDRQSWDLSVKNPNAAEAKELRSPKEILAEIAALDAESAQVLARIGGLLG